jgi:hypothetical protein
MGLAMSSSGELVHRVEGLHRPSVLSLARMFTMECISCGVATCRLPTVSQGRYCQAAWLDKQQHPEWSRGAGA